MSVWPFIAVTDADWTAHLRARSPNGRVDEVNFWSPSATIPMKAFAPGTPVFFRLKRPFDCIAGYGFFAHFAPLQLDAAWSMFGDKNGCANELDFLARIGRYRHVHLRDRSAPREPIGCTILRDAFFWPDRRRIPWGASEGWHANIVRGKTEGDPARASRLLAEIQYDQIEVPADFASTFEPIDADEREFELARRAERLGQGAFRARLLDAYGRRCAITGDHTEPILDAAHVQPYLGPRSNHVQNGLLLSQEFHTLFDLGMVTVTPELRVRVSTELRERWKNGRRFYEYNDRQLLVVPTPHDERPSASALAWHNARRFRS